MPPPRALSSRASRDRLGARAVAFSLAFGLATALALACGGSGPTDLFTPTTGAEDSGSATDADGTVDGHGGEGDAHALDDATVTPRDASTADATDDASRDASVDARLDAPFDAPADATPVVDGAVVDRIDCPGASTGAPSRTCAVGTQTCCRRGAATAYTYACESPPPTGCTSMGSGPAPLSVTCDDAHDCAALGRPNAVCCGDYVTDAQNQPSVVSVSCMLPSRCIRTQSRIVLCGDGDSAQCPAASHCDISQTALPGFRVCVAN